MKESWVDEAFVALSFPMKSAKVVKSFAKKQVAGVRSTRKRTGGWRNAVHPWSLTRNLRILHWKKKIIFQIIIFRFHVNLPGCMMGMLDDIISLFNSCFFAGWRWLKDVLNPTHLCKHLVFVESLPLENQQIPNHQETETEWIHQTCIMHDVSVYAKNEECIKTCLSYNADVDNHDRIHMV